MAEYKTVSKGELLLELIIQAQKNTGLDIQEWITADELEDVKNFEDVVEIILDKEHEICEFEYVYSYDAIKFLMENDTSLAESLELASDLGYQINDLNSTLLATLLATQMNVDDLQDYVLPKLEKLLENFDLNDED